MLHGLTVWDALQGQIQEGAGLHVLGNLFSLGACGLDALTEDVPLFAALHFVPVAPYLCLQHLQNQFLFV